MPKQNTKRNASRKQSTKRHLIPLKLGEYAVKFSACEDAPLNGVTYSPLHVTSISLSRTAMINGLRGVQITLMDGNEHIVSYLAVEAGMLTQPQLSALPAEWTDADSNP